MYETTCLRAATLEEAIAWLREHDEARPLSGGITLIPMLKQSLAAPSHLIDLTRIDAMRGIAVENGTLRVGRLSRSADRNPYAPRIDLG
jgi:carbon-monoxide dehydrogenase medium subunit